MNCSGKWSYDCYQPLDRIKKIYINQIIPKENSLYLAWYGGAEEWTVYYRVKDSEEKWNKVIVNSTCIEIFDLVKYLEYEFYVEGAGLKSMIGYARTGSVPGTIVNYLHPSDPKYAFSGQHLCTPSLLKHPDGYLLASMDIFDSGAPQNLTLIFRSDDDGKSWYHYTELFPCYWGTLFLHNNEVYMLATSTEYGDLLIGKSLDGGKHWGEPTVIARGSCNRAASGWHKSGMPVIEHDGRLWCGIDYGSHKLGGHMSCLASVKAEADLLDVTNWMITDPLKYDPEWPGAVKGDERGFLEGNAVVTPDGKIGNILRYSTDLGEPQYGLVGFLMGDSSNPGKALEFYKFVPFPGNLSKFDIKKDIQSGLYFTIVSRITGKGWVKERTVLALAYSKDLENWNVLCDLVNFEESNPRKIGFQYVSFAFDGDDIIYLSRTAFNGAQSFHDNNYLSFHRIKDFRKL
ncbi:MAG: exo-alpha-sialidase [Lachnospiraceae bacterium]|nr:exo-alpha-sialidase [Lachnospiraceae bacterium]